MDRRGDARAFPVRPEREGGELIAGLVAGRWLLACHHGNEVVTFYPERLLGRIGYLLERHARTHRLDVDRLPLAAGELDDERRARRRRKYLSRFAHLKPRGWRGA